jgi:hypothetical protein
MTNETLHPLNNPEYLGHFTNFEVFACEGEYFWIESLSDVAQGAYRFAAQAYKSACKSLIN